MRQVVNSYLTQSDGQNLTISVVDAGHRLL